MSGQDIHDYIKQQRAANVSDEAIKQALMTSGWNESDVAAALHPDTHYPNIYNGQLLGPIELLKHSWKIFRERIWTIVGIQLIPLLIMLAMSVVLLIGVILVKLLGESSTGIIVVVGIIIGLVIFGFLIYVSLRSQVAVIIAIRDSAEKIGVKESYSRAKGKLGAFFGASFLAGLAVLGGYMLLIVPGIIFSVWFMFSAYIAVDEGIGGSAALSKSREYTKGLWWEIAARVMFVALVSLGLNLLPHLFSVFGPVVDAIMTILIGIGSFLIAPVFYIYPFELYRNIKTLKINAAPIKTDTGKLFLLIIGEVVLFIVLYAATYFLSIKPEIEKALEKAKEETRQNSDIHSLDTNTFMPFSALLQARDTARTADLATLQSGLTLYYDQQGNLPATLDALVPEYISQIPLDPKTHNQYEYTVTGEKTFRVCAEFETTTPKHACVTDHDYSLVQGVFSKHSNIFSLPELSFSHGFQLFLDWVKDLGK